MSEDPDLERRLEAMFASARPRPELLGRGVVALFASAALGWRFEALRLR
jgi:hypothetical protein